jgi:hypothetical protein
MNDYKPRRGDVMKNNGWGVALRGSVLLASTSLTAAVVYADVAPPAPLAPVRVVPTVPKLAQPGPLPEPVNITKTISTSPNSNKGSGAIPPNYGVVNFSVSNGNWVATLTLPNSAKNGAVINITSTAGYNTNIATTNTDIPLPTILLKNGESQSFVYSSADARWIAQSLKTFTPNTDGATVPDLTGFKMARYAMSNGNWTATVTLPVTAADNTLLLVNSDADLNAQISSANIMYASTLNLRKGDRYAFVFRANLNRWVPIKTAVRVVAAPLATAALTAITAPQTEVVFDDGHWTGLITLPATAGDRDKVIVRSTASQTAEISNSNLAYQGTLKVTKGDRYEFIYILEKNQWAMQSHPTKAYGLKDLAAGQLPDNTTPLVTVNAANDNWNSALLLPLTAKPGDQVIVQNDADADVSVTARDANFSGKTLSTGDVVRFIRNSSNQWTVETRTVSMLLVYSDQATDRLGASAMKARLMEGVRLTNEALQNSVVNFYVKAVGYFQHELQGDTLGDAINYGRSDTVLQAQRDLLKADAVYYEGTEDGCGLAWVNQNPSKYNMLGSGSLNCGTTVMRHEFGHNMGLNHGGEGSLPRIYAQGYTLLATIMGGNAIPFYSTPNLYTQDIGMPMGIVDQIDETRALNENSEAVSKFY